MRTILAGATVCLFACIAVPQSNEAIDDQRLLDQMQQRCFRFFREQADPKTGLIVDRAPADGGEHFDVASIASTGFGLSAVCIADRRGWIERDAAYQRVLTTLRFLWEKMPVEHGWYYHFADIATGERAWNCELSSIDTALLLAGVLTARQHYRGTEVEELATQIYHRVDFPWMLGGGGVLSMGWSPENGFLNADWDGYSEHMVLQLLALGSPTHPLPPASWNRWKRRPVITHAGTTFLACPPLFTHQFSHAYVDFRGKRDDFADYWHNSVLATRAHRRMCIEELSGRFPHYGERLWGITASDYEKGYTAWGGPPATPNIDGTVVPCAAAGSIPFAPEACLLTLRHMRERYGERIWKRYGFVDAFNPQTGWVARDVIGIDKGITITMIENFRTGLVWELFMANPEIQRAMQLAGFRPLEETSDGRTSSVFGLEAIPAEILVASWRGDKHARVRRIGQDWDGADWQTIDATNALERGQPTPRNDVRARFAFLWDDESLYVRVRVEDTDIISSVEAEQLHRQDCVELFIDPQDDGLRWGDPADLQLGFAVPDKTWEWFGEGRRIDARVIAADGGYEVSAAIPWKMLGVEPAADLRLRASIAVQSVGRDSGSPIKLNWQWRDEDQRIRLGTLLLLK